MCTIIKDLHQRLSKMNAQDYIENFLIYNLSIVISGNKPSATVTLKKGEDSNYEKWIKFGVDFVEKIGLQHIVLRETTNAIILLIYDEKILQPYIFKQNNYEFLISIGYSKNKCFSQYLNKLKERYYLYNCPHELGVFLGFPINDVRDFMKCTKKKCLMCGYWKVYNDLEFAVKTFQKYDFIKKEAAKNIVYGITSHDLVGKLKRIC